jgi:hypothetical protein
VQAEERARIEKYLKAKFNTPTISVRARGKKTDSAEVYLGADDFLGTISKDEEDGELCYHFTMTILDIDLDI